MNIEYLKEYLSSHEIAFEENVDLKKRTWIHRGGTAEVFILPSNADELKSLVQFLYVNNIEFKLFGHTSNIYVRNETNIPVVVSTTKCNKYTIEADHINCEAGVSVIKLAKDMVSQGVKGFECLTGLPGTVAAALVNNSSCKENNISELLISAVVVLNDGSIVEYKSDDFKFAFRTSVFKQSEVKGTIISVCLKLDHSDVIMLQRKAEQNALDRARRLDGHAKNLGCTVNRTFSLGRMPLKYRLPALIIKLWCKVVGKSNVTYNSVSNKLLCDLSGCQTAYPYISKKNTIVFMWLDEKADDAFPVYLDYMKKVYKTDKMEIEVL